MRSAVSQAAVAALFATVLLAPGLAAAAAAPTGILMGPLYVEPVRTADNPAPPSANGCAVQIVEIKDSRREAETVGSFLTFRAMQAPPDREAWLRSVFEVGLKARGFNPSFAAADGVAAVRTDAVTARVRIQSIWISLQAMNKVGSVVFRAAASRGGTPGAEKIYRGDKTAVNWWGSQKEFNGLLNDLFAIALDDLAADLRPLCSAPATAATPAA